MAFRYLLVLVMVGVGIGARADVKAKVRTTVAGTGTESSTLVKGPRQRQEMENIITIYQCDLHRMVLINPANRTYRVISLEEVAEDVTAPARSARTSRNGRPGGLVTFNTTFRDTGARKKMLGHTARNLKSETTSEVSPGACSASPNVRMSSDGWYIDLPGSDLSCADVNRASLRLRVEDPACTDRTQFRTRGPVLPGFPISVETNMATSKGDVLMKQETIELQTTVLDPTLFEIPEGYRRVGSQAELLLAAAAPAEGKAAEPLAATHELRRPARSTRTGEPRKALIRVGLAHLAAPEGANAEVQRLEFGHSLNALELETIMLDATSATPTADAVAEAKEKGCQYLLFADLAASGGVRIRLFEIAGSDALRLDSTIDPGEEKTLELVFAKAAAEVAKQTLRESPVKQP